MKRPANDLTLVQMVSISLLVGIVGSVIGNVMTPLVIDLVGKTGPPLGRRVAANIWSAVFVFVVTGIVAVKGVFPQTAPEQRLRVAVKRGFLAAVLSPALIWIGLYLQPDWVQLRRGR